MKAHSALLTLALALAPAAAGAQATASNAALKVDVGAVRTVDPAHGLLICDLPDGQVTYDVTQAQVFDAAGKPAGSAQALKPGDRVRIDYVVNNGAKVSEIHIQK